MTIHARPDSVFFPAHRNLDILRALAVLAVFFSHLPGIDQSTLLGISGHDAGRVGVILFFVHTSTVLLWSMDRAKLTFEAISGWYARRAFRIYPLAVVAIIGTIMFRLPPSLTESFHWWSAVDIAANLSLTQNLFYISSVQGVLWSLPLEVQMYVALPFCFFMVQRYSVAGAAVIWVGAVLLGTVAVSGRLNVLWYAPCFAAGILAYGLTRYGMVRFMPAYCWLPGLLITSTVLARQVSVDRSRAWLVSLCVAILVSCVRESCENITTRAAAQIAKYSYGIYICHVPCMWLGFGVLASAPVAIQWGVTIGGTALLSVAAFHLIEDPMIRLGKRLTERSAVPHSRVLIAGSSA